MKITNFWILLFICAVGLGQSKTISEEIEIWNDSIQLPGTLTYSKTMEQQPLIIYVPGSGNPDRNGNQPKLNVNAGYIKQLSDALNENDIAFFRYDKRNVTESNIKFILKHYVFNDLVNDVASIISHFKDDKRFNDIILVGHSQGSLVSMFAIDENVDKFISLAGLGQTAGEAIVEQVSKQSEEYGKIANQHIEELNNTGTIKDINPMLVALFAKANHEFLISYLKLDPSEEIQKLNIPILILNGTKDLQVTEIDAKSLHESKPNARLKLIENMNHVLKTIDKDEDNLKSYYSPDYSLSEELVILIRDFIKG